MTEEKMEDVRIVGGSFCRFRWFIWLGLFTTVGVCYWTSPEEDSWSMGPSVVGPLNPMSVIKANDYSTPQRVAICLVGGARAFELTGPSIKKYLLEVYENADVFIDSPVDADAHKFTVLDGVPNLTSLRLFVPDRLEETEIARQVLTANGSPNGIQGLLQYFRLVEGCLDMIRDYETLHHFKYDWVVRSRVDGYWNSPMPPIESFNPSKYYVPYGARFGGLNDRLGVGTRETSQVALSRLSLLPKILELGGRDLNSESAFKAQFQACDVEVEFGTFPFCVLSTRKYRWTNSVINIPVASIISKGRLNGAKCRPCTPKVVGDAAWKLLNSTTHSRAWIGPTDDPQLCDAGAEWETNWEDIYDQASGPEMARLRMKVTNRTVTECIKDVEGFLQQWKVRDVPPAQVLCDRGSSSM